LSKYGPAATGLIRFPASPATGSNGGGGWMIDDIGLVTYAACGTQFPARAVHYVAGQQRHGRGLFRQRSCRAAVSGATGYEAFFGASSDSLACSAHDRQLFRDHAAGAQGGQDLLLVRARAQ
jgi:hypothetical protein